MVKFLNIKDIKYLTQNLGRIPRGAIEIPYRCQAGNPVVLKTAPNLPSRHLFPTLFYLVNPNLITLISQLESVGLMQDINKRLKENKQLFLSYKHANKIYLSERNINEALNISFNSKAMPYRVTCLHVAVAHSLAKGYGVNSIGDEILAKIALKPNMSSILDSEVWL